MRHSSPPRSFGGSGGLFRKEPEVFLLEVTSSLYGALRLGWVASFFLGRPCGFWECGKMERPFDPSLALLRIPKPGLRDAMAGGLGNGFADTGGFVSTAFIAGGVLSFLGGLTLFEVGALLEMVEPFDINRGNFFDAISAQSFKISAQSVLGSMGGIYFGKLRVGTTF